MKTFIAALAFIATPFVAHAADYTIRMTAEGFEPSSVTIATGDTVTFINDDARERWPASNIHPTHTLHPGSDIRKCGTDGEKTIFDACRGLTQGESYQFTFTSAGTWRFHDHLYASLGGEIIVKGESGNVSQDTRSLREVVKEISQWFSDQGTRLYLALFPAKRVERLSSLDMYDVANDDAKLRSTLRIFGAEDVMNELVSDAEGGPSVRDCHQQAHQTGRVAFELYGGSVFGRGSAACASGFYHGAMEAFLQKNGTENLAGDVVELCGVFRSSFSTFECLHGVGHGVMAYENYDLPTALSLCKRLEGDLASQSCYGGVFMENIITAQGLGAIRGHETSWVSDDPLFPCNSVGDEYPKLYECYQMQTAWMLTLTNHNFPAVARLCLGAPEHMIPVCYKSFGRDAAGAANRNPEKILSLCASVPRQENYYAQCVEGAVHVIADYWGPALKTQADEFCAVVSDAHARENCYAVVKVRKEQFIER